MFIDVIEQKIINGHTDEGLDDLYETIDLMLRNDDFAEIDKVLAYAATKHFSISMRLGLLTITLAAKSKLPSRHLIYQSFPSESAALVTGLQ